MLATDLELYDTASTLETKKRESDKLSEKLVILVCDMSIKELKDEMTKFKIYNCKQKH